MRKIHREAMNSEFSNTNGWMRTTTKAHINRILWLKSANRFCGERWFVVIGNKEAIAWALGI